MSQAGPGKIRIFEDFTGPGYPILSTHAVNAASGGGQSIGDLVILGQLADNDAGVVRVDSLTGGVVRLTGTGTAEVGCALTTGLMFSVPLMGSLVMETRVQGQVLTARNYFAGFCGLIADNIAPPSASDTVTHTLTADDQIGFHIDTSLSAGTTWHCIYNGGTTSGDTVSTNTVSTRVAVAGEWDVLRVQIDIDGTVEWLINGEREFKLDNVATVTSTDLLAALVGTWGTTSTITDIDVDYFLATANRDWTI
jgi:hypothetical protein